MNKVAKTSFRWVVHNLWFLHNVSTVSTLFLLRNRITKFSVRLVNLLSKEDVNRLTRKSMLIMLILCAYISISMVTESIGRWSRVDGNLTTIIMAIKVPLIDSFYTEFMILSIVLYWLQYELLVVYQIRTLETSRNHLMKTQVITDISLRRAFHALMRITKTMDEFDDAFSPLPLFWFVTVFFSGAGHTFAFSDQDFSGVINLLNFLLPIVFSNTVLVCLILYMESCQRKLKGDFGTKTKAVMALDTTSGPNEIVLKQAVMTQLQEVLDRKFTAFGFFTLEKPFLLSFTASLITFTVLFMEFA